MKKLLIKLDNSVCDEAQKKFTVKLAIEIFNTLFQSMNTNEVSIEFHCILMIIYKQYFTVRNSYIPTEFTDQTF